MRILRIIPSMHPSYGGPSQGIRNIVPLQEAEGIATEIICLDDASEDYLASEQLKIWAVGRGKGSWRYQKNLRNWLLSNIDRFDIVIIHGLWTYHSYVIRKILSKRKKEKQYCPVCFVIPHGMLDPYFQKAPDRKLKAVRNWFYWKLLESKLVNSIADAVLFTCEEEMKLARQAFRPYRPAAEYNSGYGIQRPPAPDKTERASFLPTVSDKPYLLYLGRVDPKKGVDLLIDGYLKLVSANTSLPALVIAGPGMDTEFGSSLRKKASFCNDIHFTGLLTGSAKWAAFYHAEAFVLPSHQENFGISVVEALACGKPVLISNKINIWREIVEGGAGVAQDDSMEGVIQLLQYWSDASESTKARMSDCALNTYEKLWTVTSSASRLKNIFDEQLKEAHV